MRRWDGLVDGYTRVCRTRGLAEVTIEDRVRELERFGNWLKRRKPKVQLDRVSSEHVIRFISDRAAFRLKSRVCCVVSHLRGMGEYLVQEGIWAQNPLRWIRGPKLDRRRRLPKRIRKPHLKALWAAAQNRRQEHARYQAVCLLAILYGTGMRRGELERLDLEDWDRDNATLKVDGRKTGKARSLAVSEGVWRCIEAYLPYRHNQLEKFDRLEERALLINRDGKRMSGTNVRALLRSLAKSADVPFVTIHQFRHSCASDLLEAGVALPDVQKMLGHATIQSTVIYVDVADPCRAAAMEKHPVNQILCSQEAP